VENRHTERTVGKIPSAMVEDSAAGKQVAQFFFLGLEIVFGVKLRFNLAGDPLDHGNAGGFEGGDFIGVVGEETDLMDT